MPTLNEEQRRQLQMEKQRLREEYRQAVQRIQNQTENYHPSKKAAFERAEANRVANARHLNVLQAPVMPEDRYQPQPTPLVFRERRRSSTSRSEYTPTDRSGVNPQLFVALFPVITIGSIVLGHVMNQRYGGDSLIVPVVVWLTLVAFAAINAAGYDLYWFFSMLFWTIAGIALVAAIAFFSNPPVIIVFS